VKSITTSMSTSATAASIPPTSISPAPTMPDNRLDLLETEVQKICKIQKTTSEDLMNIRETTGNSGVIIRPPKTPRARGGLSKLSKRSLI